MQGKGGSLVQELIHQGKHSRISRGISEKNQRIIIKQPSHHANPASANRRLLHESDILNELNISGVIRPLGCPKADTGHSLTFLDNDLISLREWLVLKRPAFLARLKTALSLSQILGQIHEARIIHKQITPDNILISALTEDVYIIDFSMSSRLSREHPTLGTPQTNSDNLSYIAPEQTGRINRYIDYRTDYYSLGITLYEIFTGALPFTQQNNQELLHCHIARQPTAPHLINPELPTTLSNIILKLLAKDAAHRYQSSYGLCHDINTCMEQALSAEMQDFPVGSKDVSERFELPQTLYGRSSTVAQLQTCFDNATAGEQSMALITGYAGVGKSSVVHELRHYISQHHGLFASGKFDQYHRNRPYTAIYQAMQTLVRQLLTEPDERIKHWRLNLQEAFGNNAQVLLKLIPELELIIGAQPEAPSLSPSEEQHRFSHIFRQMLKVFATAEHPLVLFFDDLHWADLSSLTLLEKLSHHPQHPHLLIIGSYRDQEFNHNHPFQLSLQRLKNSPLCLFQFEIKALTLDDIKNLIADTLRHSTAESEPLAKICFEKTQGNPFFLNQFLLDLYEKRLIHFQGNRWTWNESEIRSCEITDNVIDFMVDKIRRLSPQTQSVLQIAACIGNPVALPILAAVCDQSADQTATDLWPAISEGLIFSLEASQHTHHKEQPEQQRYRFVHDRVQQAAYSLISPDDIQNLHYQIGGILQKKNPEPEQGRGIFDLTNHLNQAQSLIKTTAEKTELSRLNLQAGLRAKEAAAFESAFDYFQKGIELLTPDCWDTQHSLALSLHQHAAEAAYIKADFTTLHQLVDTALPHCHQMTDKVRLQELQIQALVSTNHFDDALHVALRLLKQLNFSLPNAPSALAINRARLSSLIRLFRYSDKQILSLPKMTHPEALAAMPILTSMFGVVKFSSSGLRPLVMAREVELTLRFGLSNESAMAFAGYGGVLCGKYQKFELGYRLGALALKLAQQTDNNRIEHKVQSLFNTYIRHYKEPLKLCSEALLEAHNSGLETGDIEWSAYSLAAHIQFTLPLSNNLDQLVIKLREYVLQLQETGQKQSLQYSLMALQFVEVLRHPSAPAILNGEYYDEKSMLIEHHDKNHKTAICLHFFYQSFLAFIFKEHQQADKLGQQALKFSSYISGTYTEPFVHYIHALNTLLLLPSLRESEQMQRTKEINNYLKSVSKLAEQCPQNHEHHRLLIKAALLTYEQSYSEAIDLYDQALLLMQQNSFHLEFAIGNELASQCYRSWGKHAIAHHYLTQAYQAYDRLGAKNKLRQLETEFSDLIPVITQRVIPELAEPLISNEPTEQSSRAYDVSSVIKASQAISDEIVLEPLLSRLINLAIENAGAQRAVLLLNRQSLVIEAEASIDGQTQYYDALALEDGAHLLPVSIIHYVARTKENVVLGHASRHEMFQQDTYIQEKQPLSLLCMPIMYHGELTAILYLENSQSRDVFDRNRLEALQILSAQAAISIENAKLYQSLKQSEYNYKSLFMNAVEGIFRASPEGRFISANPALATLLGYQTPNAFLNEIIDIASQCFIENADLRDFMGRLDTHQQIVNFETRWQTKSGHPIYVSISARIVKNSQGYLEYYEGSLTDISERKAKEAAEQARNKAEAENEEKSRFLATMSHEIRTPMNGILGMTQLLRKSDLNTTQIAHVDTIYKAGQSLLAILNDILDFSKAESGRLELEARPFNIGEVLDEVYCLFMPLAQEKALQIVPQIDRMLPTVMGDRRALTQILMNLCSNALKFTHKGFITLKALALSHTEESINVRIEIKDTGIGIAEASQAKIFQHFIQADNTITRRYGGTGLGLAITKRMIEQQGGIVGFSSTEHQGSTFWFELSYPLCNETTQPDTPKITAVHPITALDILLVEDALVNQQVAKGLLESDGHNVSIAEDGFTALSMHNDHLYDLILMDIHLPDMDGMTTTQKIRSHKDPARATIKIIALTASVSHDEIEQYKRAGMDGVLAKPIQFEALQQLLSNNMSIGPDRMPTQHGNYLNTTLLAQHQQLLGTERIQKLIEQFYQMADTLLPEIEATIKNNQLAQLVTASHTLAGAAANFGFQALHAHCQQIERAAQAGLLSEVTGLTKQTKHLYNDSKTELSHYFKQQKENDSV